MRAIAPHSKIMAQADTPLQHNSVTRRVILAQISQETIWQRHSAAQIRSCIYEAAPPRKGKKKRERMGKGAGETGKNKKGKEKVRRTGRRETSSHLVFKSRRLWFTSKNKYKLFSKIIRWFYAVQIVLSFYCIFCVFGFIVLCMISFSVLQRETCLVRVNVRMADKICCQVVMQNVHTVA